MAVGEREIQQQHYSEKGGHKVRSEFWRRVRRSSSDLQRMLNYPPRLLPLPKEVAFMVKRDMPRNPKDGRR